MAGSPLYGRPIYGEPARSGPARAAGQAGLSARLPAWPAHHSTIDRLARTVAGGSASGFGLATS
jgi:hypothetical protein